MSEDIEPEEQHEQQEEQDLKSSSVPIISDKEIEAIFVGGVPADADDVYLQNQFQKFGDIKSVKIINSTKTSTLLTDPEKPKRFAIVTFNQPIPSSILNQDHWMIGRKVDVKEYLSGEEANSKLNREKQRKIFVGGLPLSVNNGREESDDRDPEELLPAVRQGHRGQHRLQPRDDEVPGVRLRDLPG